MAFNNYLSINLSRQISPDFACQSSSNDVALLFVMKIDPKVREQSGVPFVYVEDESYFKKDEEEILFATHSVFRIQRIDQITDGKGNPMWEVHLTLIGKNDQEMGELIKHIRKEIGLHTGWSPLGWILIKIGQSEKAEQLYQVLLDKTSSDTERALCLNQLSEV